MKLSMKTLWMRSQDLKYMQAMKTHQELIKVTMGIAPRQIQARYS